MPFAGSISVHCQTRGIRKIELPVGLVERTAILQQPIEKPGGTSAGFGHVDVRVGAVADHGARVTYHLGCHVGVVVEAGDERNSLPDYHTDAAHQFALSILEVLGHHRPVQIEINRIHRPLRLQILDDPPGYLLIGFALDIRGGWRGTPAQRYQLVPEPL
jgi:hypothetical protein